MTQDIFTRDISNWKPNTFNDATRSVKVVAVTENPIRTWDWEQKAMVSQIVLISGAQIPANGQVPLLDSHNRASVSSVLGSARNFSREGSQLECEVFFAGTATGQDAAWKVKEGHLTDFSVGFIINESKWIPEGQTVTADGRAFAGPARLVTRWELLELSITPVGADRLAKVRSLMPVTMPVDPAIPESGDLPSMPPAPDPLPEATPPPDSRLELQPVPPSEPLPEKRDAPALNASAQISASPPSGTEKQGISTVDIICYLLCGLILMIFLAEMME